MRASPRISVGGRAAALPPLRPGNGLGALRLDKGHPQLDLVTDGFPFLRPCVFELGGPFCTWQKRLLDDPKSVASCG